MECIGRHGDPLVVDPGSITTTHALGIDRTRCNCAGQPPGGCIGQAPRPARGLVWNPVVARLSVTSAILFNRVTSSPSGSSGAAYRRLVFERTGEAAEKGPHRRPCPTLELGGLGRPLPLVVERSLDVQLDPLGVEGVHR